MMTGNTLMSMSKSELVNLVLMYQNNQRVLEETINQQYINATNLLRDMNVFNKTFENVRGKMEL